MLIASTQNAGVFNTDGGNREDLFNLIAEAAGGKDRVVKDFLTSEGGEYSHSKLTCAIFVCIDQETADRVRTEAQRRKFNAFTWAEASQDPRLASFTQGVVTKDFHHHGKRSFLMSSVGLESGQVVDPKIPNLDAS